MADPESFLARWSRRKRDAASQEGNRSKPASVADESSPAATDTSMPDTSMPGDVEPPFDPACLPPLDSIGSGSDVRPFLAAGVPAELKRMALRRAWLTDPTIDMALDLTAGRRGLTALGEVMTRWTKHMLAIDVAIEPLTEMRGAAFTWYVGLDAAGTRIGDALWNGEELDDASRGRIVALYRLTVGPPAVAPGAPVYLILAMTSDKVLRMKPQNLLTGLPVRQGEAVN